MLNNDYKEILYALLKEKVEFILVGAYAMSVHGYSRATFDLDLWLFPSLENGEAVIRALEFFGAPMNVINLEDFQNQNLEFQIGVAPKRIDLVMGLDGLNFREAYKHAVIHKIDDIEVPILSLDYLIINKTAIGRLMDQIDVIELKKLRDEK